MFADAISRYFTDHEPESIYVAQVNATVIGCVFGAKDVAVMSKIFGEKLALWLVLKVLKHQFNNEVQHGGKK